MVSAHDVMRRIVWVVQCTVTLIWSMGSGLLWMFNSVRFITYALILQPTFFNHVLHYVSSPTIIRGVQYRSSRAAKLRHLKFLLHNDALKSTIECASAFLEQQGGVVRTPSRDFSPPNPSQPQALGAGASPTSSSSSDDNASADSSEEDPEDAANMHNRSFLDIWLPVPLDALMKTFSPLSHPNIHPATNNRTSASAAAARHGHKRKRFPIIVIVGGGAWIIGYNLWSNAIARQFAAKGYLVFTVDYRNFPQATMTDMVLDVTDAIAWVIRNAEQYNGDASDITVFGQSAGAHLAMMSLISQGTLSSEHDDIAAGRRPPAVPGRLPHEVLRFNPRTHIQRFVGVSGIYNLRRLIPHFHQRGLYRHVLYKIMGGRQRMGQFMPPAYFEPRRHHHEDDDYDEAAAAQGEQQQPFTRDHHHHHHHHKVVEEMPTPDNFFDYLPKSFSFLHGDADTSAPLHESSHLAHVMYEAQVRKIGAQRKASQTGFVPRNGSTDDFHTSGANGQPAVEIHYVKIRNASHTDPIVEEAVSSDRCCLVDYVDFLRGSRTDVSAVPQQLSMTTPPERMSLVMQIARVINPF